MKRKHVAKKKPARKKPTVKANNLVGLPGSSCQHANENIGSGKPKDNNFVVPDAQSDSNLSSSSSSSGSPGAFDVEEIVKLAIAKGVKIQANKCGLDEMEIDKGVKVPATNPGRPSKKAKVSSNGVDMSVLNALSGLNSLSAMKNYSNRLQMDSRYNEKELKASLAVIKKVMEMDEATSFNTPVDPVTLGIPHYFDVVETPMDFGTMCNNLQNGLKYLNSGDVYKDVEYIWENCLKFNKKGDYIVYLMKRVKKEFEKYWISAGLHIEIARKNTVPFGDDSTRHGRNEAAIRDSTLRGKPGQVEKDTYGIYQPHSQVLPSSSSLPNQSLQPQLSQQPLFPHLQSSADSHLAGLSHLVAYIDKAIRQSRHEASFVDRSVANLSQMQNDDNGISQQHSQVPPSSFSQPFHYRHGASYMVQNDTFGPCCLRSNVRLASHKQPTQPSTNQPPQHAEFQADANSDFSGKSLIPCENDSDSSGTHELEKSAAPGAQIPLLPDHSLAHQFSGSHNQPNESLQRVKKRRGRGRTRCSAVLELPNGERLHVPVNSLGQPIGTEAFKLASFLGTIARNGKLCPLTIPDWRAIPDEKKEEMWLFVLTKFDVDTKCKSWVLKSIAKNWRNFKARLKAECYDACKTDEERLLNRDERVLPDQWPVLISYWSSEEWQLRCEINKANRANQKVTHTSGTKSFARLREEVRAKRPDGNEPSRADLYKITRTRKDGQPLNEKAAEIIAKLNERAAQKQQTSQTSNNSEDTFLQVMGPEKCGQVRCYGLGATSSELSGNKKRCQLQFMQVAPEAKRATNEEVSNLEAKMEAMEQKFASMEAQIARMTSSMQDLLEKMAGPSKTSGVEQRRAHSSSSSHAIQ